MLPVITTDKDIDVVRPLEIPEGIREDYVTANKKVHQACKSAPPKICSCLAFRSGLAMVLPAI